MVISLPDGVSGGLRVRLICFVTMDLYEPIIVPNVPEIGRPNFGLVGVWHCQTQSGRRFGISSGFDGGALVGKGFGGAKPLQTLGVMIIIP